MRQMIWSRGVNLWNLLHGVRKEHRLMLTLMGLWSLVTEFWSSPELIAGINESVPLMVLLGLMSFLVVVHLCWWLLQKVWFRLGLPAIEVMVLSFKSMELWKQLGFFWLSFALLLASAVGCLAAVL